MRDHTARRTTVSKALILNLAVLAGFLAAEYLLVQGAKRFGGAWQTVDLAMLAGCLAGGAIAVKLHARLMAYVIAAFAAVFTAELGIHLYYGIRAAQGAPTHFAVLASGVLGVALGALLAKQWFRAAKTDAVDASAAQAG